MVSIVVPVYNIKTYLPICFNSILAQTYANYEAIIIDYGSTDGSGELCESYASTDNRFRVIHCKNVDLGEARNVGIREAKGDYVAFIDADDYVHPQYLDVLVRLMATGDYQLAGCRYIHPTGNADSSLQATYDLSSAKTFKVSGRQLLEGLFFRLPIKDYSYKTVWGGIFKKSIIDGVFFADYPMSEDVDYSSRLYQQIQSAIIVDLQMYYWVERKGSMHNSSFSYKSLQRILSFYQAKENIPTSEGRIRALGMERLYLELMYTRQKSTEDMKNRTQKFLLSIHNKNRRELLRQKHIGLLFKIYMCLALPLPGLHAVSRRVINYFERKQKYAVARRFVGAKK